MTKQKTQYNLLRASRAGLCQIGDQFFWMVEYQGKQLYAPLAEFQAIDPYMQALRQYLVLKYEGDIAEAFLDYGLQKDVSEYFNDEGLDREAVVIDVDVWLDSV